MEPTGSSGYRFQVINTYPLTGRLIRSDGRYKYVDPHIYGVLTTNGMTDEDVWSGSYASDPQEGAV